MLTGAVTARWIGRRCIALRKHGLVVAMLAGLALFGFAGNSLLCRLALGADRIDAVAFTLVRILSGAATLAVIVAVSAGRRPMGGDWISATALLGYALLFSLAYRLIPAGAGALFLFGAVQVTMIAAAIAKGEQFDRVRMAGLTLAAVGLFALLLPRFGTPSAGASAAMFGAGIAWGIYSLRGRQESDPLDATAGNFLRAAAPILIIAVLYAKAVHWDTTGLLYASISGAVTSGLGYAAWYRVLGSISRTSAATLQLGVPVLTSIAAVPLLGESVTADLAISTVLTLGGIAMVVIPSRKKG
jgi:drug/metabolite transporter (DMT)-like permease